MSSVVCCSTVEVKYRKKGGGCKSLNDSSIQVSEIDCHLNDIMRKSNFHSFISVKMTNIHERPLCSADDTDSDSDVSNIVTESDLGEPRDSGVQAVPLVQ